MEEEVSNYATILVIGFVTMVVLVVMGVCIFSVRCLIQAIQETDIPDAEDSLSNSFNILSRSQKQALRAMRESVNLADRRISDQLNL